MAEIKKFPGKEQPPPAKVRIYCPKCGGEAWAVYGAPDAGNRTQIVEIECLGCPNVIRARPEGEDA